MAKIGVITFTDTLDNYGQVLQFIATKEYLESRGHKVYMLRNEKDNHLIAKLKRVVKRYVMPCFSSTYAEYARWDKNIIKIEKTHPRKFEDFRKITCNIIYTNLKKLSYDQFDVVCSGSDQIWSRKSSWFYLGFNKQNTLKISISSSTGGRDFNNKEIKNIKQWLTDFDFITVREQSGVDLCKKAECNNIKRLLDPTFLTHIKNYTKYAEKTVLPKRQYIFLYMVGAKVELGMAEIYKFAELHNLDVVYVASQGREDTYEKLYATVPQWLFVMEHSSYVITNSFHGMAMSIVYHKKFLTLPLIGITKNMNERIYNLAEQFGLEGRIYKGNLMVLFNNIDYKDIELQISINRQSLNQLMSSVNL